METVDVTLGHGAGTSHLEADSAVVHTVVQGLKAGDTNVLQRVLDTRNQVGDELGDGATVKNGTSNTLSNQDAVLLGEVTSSTSVAGLAVLATGASLAVLHGSDTAHTTVGLDKLTLFADEVLTGRLGGTGKETSHHDSGGTCSQTLDDVANVLDTTISNARNAEAGSERSHAADGGGLGTTDSHDLLGDAGTAAAHANSQAIDTSSNQSCGLLTSDNVTTDNVDLGEVLLDPLDHLNLVHAVTLAAVQDNNVETSINKELESGLVLLTGTNGSSGDELLRLGELGGEGVVEVLHQIAAGQQGDEVAVLIDNGELALLGGTEDLVSLGQGGASGGSDEVSGHDGGDGVIKVAVELDVTGSDNTNKLGAEGSVLCSNKCC